MTFLDSAPCPLRRSERRHRLARVGRAPSAAAASLPCRSSVSLLPAPERAPIQRRRFVRSHRRVPWQCSTHDALRHATGAGQFATLAACLYCCAGCDGAQASRVQTPRPEEARRTTSHSDVRRRFARFDRDAGTSRQSSSAIDTSEASEHPAVRPTAETRRSRGRCREDSRRADNSRASGYGRARCLRRSSAT